MKFTIVTSFHNGAKFVNQLYSKIQEQTYNNWAWVVTDDFSDDNTKELLLELEKRDKRIKYVEQNHKKEMFWNPQKFCKDAEIIVQQDQDDWPLPRALEVYHHFFTKFPDVILITCAGNMYNENGSWRCGYNPDYSKANNMSYGYLTLMRAWRNNPNLSIEFNPGNWMQYFYNDLEIVCGLEEIGKVLNLPRNLYYYLYRDTSISHASHNDISLVRDENRKLIQSIVNRRFDNDIDTLCRYFESIYLESHCFMSNSLNDRAGHTKIAYINNQLSTTKKNLIKELFYDFDINFNVVHGDEDYLIYVVREIDDILKFVSNDLMNSIGNKILSVWDFYSLDENIRENMMELLRSRYGFYFEIDIHMTIHLL